MKVSIFHAAPWTFGGMLVAAVILIISYLMERRSARLFISESADNSKGKRAEIDIFLTRYRQSKTSIEKQGVIDEQPAFWRVYRWAYHLMPLALLIVVFSLLVDIVIHGAWQ